VTAVKTLASRQITLSVAQIQSLALKTLGFAPDKEVWITAPYDDSTEIEFDIYHVRVGIDHDGIWRAYALKDGDAEMLLSRGDMPRFEKWREVG
jgi:hypothetical protein